MKNQRFNKTESVSSQLVRRMAAVASFVVGCVGCTAVPSSFAPEQMVSKLAEERWMHLIDGRWGDAYNMLTPAYRAVHSEREYRQSFRGAVQWQGAKVVSIKCEPDKCDLRLTLTVSNPLARRVNDTITTTILETWLLDEGRWYHYTKP